MKFGLFSMVQVRIRAFICPLCHKNAGSEVSLVSLSLQGWSCTKPKEAEICRKTAVRFAA